MKLRREFDLTESDRRFLEASGFVWETLIDGNSRWVFVHERSVPRGFNHERVSVASLLTPGYPDTALDMFYVKPALARRNGKSINALSNHTIRNETWQRWSRHRTSQNPWRPGDDDLSTHLMLVEGLLEREVGLN